MSSATLLLCCVGPMQSWGSRSRFSERDTELEPTKSGVIGLCCAALGRDRAEYIEDLARLRMGVRVDREGIVGKDFHTALNVRKADSKARPDTEISNRYFLNDAAFLVGLWGNDVLLKEIDEALANPHWPLFLGRKAFVPSKQVRLKDGFRQGESLENSLATYQRIASPRRGESDRVARLVLETTEKAEGEARMDVPLSFEPSRRRYGVRRVAVSFIDLGQSK